MSMLKDPIKFGQKFWPDVTFYRQQREIIYSVRNNDETFVPAGNMLGKDFVSGFIALVEFLLHPVARVITTSVKDDHLRVLWAEIHRFIQTAKYPLTRDKGGPLIVNHREIRKVDPKTGVRDDFQYLIGCVSEKGEGMAGHHAPYSLGIIDEASGVDDTVYSQMDTWAKRKLVIGNTLPCSNFFYKGVKGGDLLAKLKPVYDGPKFGQWGL